MDTSKESMLKRANAPDLAYASLPGAAPTVMFLGGFMSDMTGTKATALEAYCRQVGRGFVRFDYRGHGASGGAFADATIGAWTSDALAVIDAVTEGPLVLAGSSMGGWIALLAALARPERVGGLVGIAAAPDFTEDLLWAQYDADIRKTIMEEGVYMAPSDYDEAPYPITRQLIEEGRQHLLLRGTIGIDCPVRLLHGMADGDVPFQVSFRLLERLVSEDVTLTLVKGGDHRLSGPDNLSRLCELVERLCAQLGTAAD